MREDAYEVEVAAEAADEAVEVAAEATPRGKRVVECHAVPAEGKPGLFRVVLHFE